MTRCTPVITHNKHISTPPTLAGLFFCLASAECAGLLFCPATIHPHTSVYSVFCAVHATILHTAKNSAQGFADAFQAICRIFPLFCGCAFCYIAPSAPRWSVSQRLYGIHRYQIPAPRRTLYRTAQPPYYNKVYKGAEVRLLWIHARRCSIPQTMPTRRGLLPPCADRWQVLLPAHPLRCQRLHLYRVSPAASRCFQRPADCDLAPVSGQGAPAGTLYPAGGAEPLAANAASLFGLSPDS